MKTYIYKAINDSMARGYNRTIVVYLMKNNVPIDSAYNDRINTASTVGDKGEAVKLIGSVFGHKHNNYEFDSANVQVFGV